MSPSMVLQLKRSAFALVIVSTATGASHADAQSGPCPARWSLAFERTYDDSPAPLTNPGDVTVTAKQEIVVAESDEPVLKVFDSNGQLVKRLGRKGDGPGEFREVINLLGFGDSIWAYDPVHRRATFCRTDGKVGRIVNFRAPGTAPRLGPAYPFGEGYFALASLNSAEVIKPVGYGRRILRLSASGVVERDMMAPLIMRGYYAHLELPGEASVFILLPVPTVDRALVAERGLFAVIARGVVDTRTGARSIRVTRIRPGGDTVFSKALRVERAPVERSFVEQHQERLAKALRNRFPSELAARRAVKQVTNSGPAHFSPVNGLLLDAESRIWIRTTLARNHWIILNASGMAVTCLDAPLDVRIVAAAGGKVWAIKTDSDDVPSLERFAVVNAKG
jgi:hypothetical protein